MTRRGFRPARAEQGRRVDFILGCCPFAEVAAADPDTVCQLHLGLAEGLTHGLGGLVVERLAAKNARPGRLPSDRAAHPGAGDYPA